MSLDLEQELRLAMQEFTDDVLAPPDLLARLPRRRMRGFPRLAVVAAAAAAAVTIAGVVVVGEHTGGGGAGSSGKPLSTYKIPKDTVQRERQAAAQMNAAVANWGPTRGDKAGDQHLLTQLQEEGAHPTSHPPQQLGFEAVTSPNGAVKVLWAGTTPEGLAALAVQHTNDPVAEWWYGFFVSTSSGRPRLAERAQLVGGYDIAEPDPHLLSFATASHKTVIVVPMNATDGIRIAFSTKKDATGRLQPQWTDATVHEGAAVATVPSGGDVWGVVVEVRQGGKVVADDQIDYVDTNDPNAQIPAPANVVQNCWCNACTVGGAASPGYGLAMLEAWGVRHGPAYLRVSTSMWSMGARLRDGSPVFITQMWQPGGEGHTVAVADEQSKGVVDVLYDEVTKVSDRPLVAIRLPENSGWVVGAGPSAVITGWRTDGGDWHRMASKKAVLLHTDAGTVQLRLTVDGHQQIATRTAR